jgi:hypothetical protein
MRYKIFAFFICLIISFILWYLVGYSQKETVKISLSVQITGYSADYVLTEQSEKEIEFQVISSRHDIAKIKKRDKITVDMSDVRLKKVKGRYQGVSSIEPFFQSYLRQVNYNGYSELLSPDTIVCFFEIAEKSPVSD